MPDDEKLGERVAALEAQLGNEKREHDLIFSSLTENRNKMDTAIQVMNSAANKFSSSIGYNKSLVAIIVAQSLLIGLLAGRMFPV